MHSHSHLNYCFQKVQSPKKKDGVVHTEIFKLGKGSHKIVKAMKMSGFKVCVYPFIKRKEN
jgi:S-adenosylmethionine:tRNA-ribosyltransferase-isomerase (queuine synthetase)